MRAKLDSRMAEARERLSSLGFAAGLRPFQEEVLSRLAAGRHVFAGLPTGYGKSLCYWLPASAWGWRVWVVSPLVSLLEDQAMACQAMGLGVVAWHGMQTEDIRARTERGQWRICFLTPERLVSWESSGYLTTLAALGLAPDLLVLDEMHCLEQWREFRAAYSELIAPARKLVSRGALLLGLSASLSARDAAAWMQDLCGCHDLVLAGLGRENLHLHVQPVEREEERWLLLAAALRDIQAPDSALVYCSSRGEADGVARWLRSAGYSATSYHAGHPAFWRSARSRAFRAGLLRIVCATSAFGMGIDYPHVRLVVHFSLPYDLESYWQEVGRAGRSGRPAFALALWRRSEIHRVQRLSAAARTRFLLLWKTWAAGGCRIQAVAQSLHLAEEECGRCDECARRSGRPVASPWAMPLPVAWWVRPEARLEQWLEKIPSHSAKNLDGF